MAEMEKGNTQKNQGFVQQPTKKKKKTYRALVYGKRTTKDVEE